MDVLLSCSHCGALVKTDPQMAYRFCPECGKEFSVPVFNNLLSQDLVKNLEQQVGQFYQPNHSKNISIDFRNSTSKKVFQFSKWVGFLIVGYFLGLMIATAGIAVAPNLGKITVPFTCSQGEFLIKSQQYSYKPGQSGITRDFYCIEKNGTKKDLMFSVLFYSFLIYGTLIFVMLSVGWFFFRSFFRTSGS